MHAFYEKTPERAYDVEVCLSRLKTCIQDLSLELRLETYGDDAFPIYKAFITDKIRAHGWISGGKGYQRQSMVSAIAGCFQHYLTVNSVLDYHERDMPVLPLEDILSVPELKKFNKYSSLLNQQDAREPFSTLLFHGAFNSNSSLHYPLSLVETHYHKLTHVRGSRKLAWRAHATGSALGLSYHEALLHGMHDWIEKYSFSLFISTHFFTNNSQEKALYLDKSSLPTHIESLIHTIETRFNDNLSIIFLKNEFGIPCFLTHFNHQPDYIVQPKGFGCSLNKQYALEKSISEALECRLLRTKHTAAREKVIHKNFTNYALFLNAYTFIIPEQMRDNIQYPTIPTYPCDDVDTQITQTANLLTQYGDYTVYQHRFKHKAYGLHSVHVLIPGLNENFLIKEGKFIYEP